MHNIYFKCTYVYCQIIIKKIVTSEFSKNGAFVLYSKKIVNKIKKKNILNTIKNSIFYLEKGEGLLPDRLWTTESWVFFPSH